MNKMASVETAGARRAPNRAAAMMAARAWHSYAGAFFAPAILFFSITGALQTFNLHKPLPGWRPPAVVQALASMHKNQNLHVKYTDDPAPQAADKPAKPGKRAKADKPAEAAKPAAPLASVIAQWVLKVFAALVSVGLTATTVLGLWMAWQTTRRRTVLLCFAAGAVLPMLVMLAV